MIEGVIEMGDATVGDIMTPRTDMNAIPAGLSLRDAAAAVVEAGHSRIPIYDKSRDDIVGVLYSKDLLAELIKPEEAQASLAALVRQPVFVPETKPVSSLLEEFQKSRNHMAIVLNEFGGVAGLVTIEDVLEEIVGEIEDEFDDKVGETGIYTLADGSHRVAGDVEIAAVNEAFVVDLPVDEFDTIGGLVAQALGRVPRRGEAVPLGSLVFTVMLTRGGAVRWFKVTRAPEVAVGTDGA
jgi:magnesium and cobalt transporter